LGRGNQGVEIERNKPDLLENVDGPIIENE